MEYLDHVSLVEDGFAFGREALNIPQDVTNDWIRGINNSIGCQVDEIVLHVLQIMNLDVKRRQVIVVLVIVHLYLKHLSIGDGGAVGRY